MITRADLQAVFDALDRNADGAIDRADTTRRAR
jgi:Ca2+-binding EF-hand superfamily protein